MIRYDIAIENLREDINIDYWESKSGFELSNNSKRRVHANAISIEDNLLFMSFHTKYGLFSAVLSSFCNSVLESKV
jgi:hypothetical protein